MMEQVLLLINSVPSSMNAQRAWHMAQTLHAQGHRVTLFLIQDGVLAAQKGEAALRDLPQDVACYALGEDLQLRGFVSSDLHVKTQVADYTQLIDLFEGNHRVIGAL